MCRCRQARSARPSMSNSPNPSIIRGSASRSGSGSLQDGADKIAPSIGALFSDTFANATVGILVDAVYTRQDTQTNRVYVSGWPGGYYAPCQKIGRAHV